MTRATWVTLRLTGVVAATLLFVTIPSTP
ncbi:MAG: hypothetical protein JWP70_405, partial [Leifsonia sp.]|nr:hypothetical protein [Leifsonia sp.]